MTTTGEVRRIEPAELQRDWKSNGEKIGDVPLTGQPRMDQVPRTYDKPGVYSGG